MNSDRPRPGRGLGRLLYQAAEAAPAAPALLTGQERAVVSYERLAALANRTAEALTAAGLRQRDVVGLAGANTLEFVVGLLGACQAGLVVAPVDPGLSREEKTGRLDRLGARVVLVDPVAGRDDGPCPAWTLTRTPGSSGVQLAADGPPRLAPTNAARPAQDDALVMFTAGTTGAPKMVPWTTPALAAVVSVIRDSYQLGPGDSTVAVMPFFHGHGLVAGLLAPLASGGQVLLPTGGRFHAHTFWDDLDAAAATWFTAVPTIIEILLARGVPARPAGPRTRLRFVRTCSAPLNPDTGEAFSRLVGAPVLAAYGMTETTHQAASQTAGEDGPRYAGSVGRPTGVEVRVVGDDGRDRSAGVQGEIWVKGPTVARGYLGDPADTAASFTGGWYRTGDLGTLGPHGYLTVTGRIKTLINRGGEKISPEHVEEVLDREPTVAESAVLGQPDPTLGERVVALIVPAAGQDFDPEEVLASCRKRLARYEVPEHLQVVGRIPHTAKGAIDRTAALAAFQGLD